MTELEKGRFETWKEFYNSYKQGNFKQSDREYYLNTIGDDEEKRFGKANFEYDYKERLLDRMYKYNKSKGDLPYCCEKCNKRGYYASTNGEHYWLIKCSCLAETETKWASESSKKRR